MATPPLQCELRAAFSQLLQQSNYTAVSKRNVRDFTPMPRQTKSRIVLRMLREAGFHILSGFGPFV
jgi:hypothetical protein